MWKRILKFTVLGVVILLIVGAGWRWWSLAQLEQRLAAIREAGDPVSLADLQRPPVPPQDNAATYLARVSDDANKLFAELEPILYRQNFNVREKLSPEELAAVEEAFAAYPQVLPTLEQAAAAKTHVSPLDYTQTHTEFSEDYFEVLDQWRTFARVLHCRAVYLAVTDRPEEAVEVYLQQLRLARLQAEEPLMVVGFLVNIVVRRMAIERLNDVLQTAMLSPETYEAIDQELAHHDSLDLFIPMLKSERVYGIESFGQFPQNLVSEWIEYLDVSEELIADGDRPAYEVTDPYTADYGPLTALVIPSITQSRVALNRNVTQVRGVRIVNALKAQQIDDPAVDLSTLGLPPESLIDPFSGQPLRHEKTELGWKITNHDNVDDGAKKVTVEPPPGD